MLHPSSRCHVSQMLPPSYSRGIPQPNGIYALRATPRLHRRVTRNNIPGVSRIDPIPIIPVQTPRHRQQSAQHRQQSAPPTRIQPRRGPRATRSAIPSGAQQRIVTRHAINLLTLHEEALFNTLHTPRALMKHAKMPINFEHYANPMVHPVTGRAISSYKN
jgi:hypothetical protein